MLDLNYAAEMAGLQHEDRLRQAAKAQRNREVMNGQFTWLKRLRNHLAQE